MSTHMRAPSPPRSPPAFSAVKCLRWRAADATSSPSETFTVLCETLTDQGYTFRANTTNRTITVVAGSDSEALLWVSGRDICARRASGDTFSFHALYRRLRNILPSVRASARRDGSDPFKGPRLQSFSRRSRDSRESQEERLRDATLRSPRDDSFSRKSVIANMLAAVSGAASSSTSSDTSSPPTLRATPVAALSGGARETRPDLCDLEQKLSGLVFDQATGSGFRRTNKRWQGAAQGSKGPEGSITPSASSSCDSNLDSMEQIEQMAVSQAEQ